MSHVPGGLCYKKLRNIIRPASGVAADPFFSFVIQLMHFQGSDGGNIFVDSSSYNRTIFINSLDPRTSTDIGFVGQSSSLTSFSPFSFTGRLGINAPGAEANYDDWTIEFFWKQRNGVDNFNFGYYFANGNAIIRIGGPLDPPASLGKLQIINVGVETGISTTTVSDGNLHFIAVCREMVGITPFVSIYVDGVRETIVASGLPNMFAGGSPWEIGRTDFAANSAIRGYLGEFRVTAGVARYSGPTCPIPTAPFPDVGP